MAIDVQAPPRLLTVDEVIRMAEAGIITEGERVELVDGVLVRMSPEGFDHAGVVGRLVTRISRLYPERFEVRSQSTLPLGRRTFLEPDLYVIEAPDWLDRWPTPAEVALVVEVAFTSAKRDRGEKARRYAAWGAGVYWVIDLTRREVVVHTDPGPDGYTEVSVVNERGTLAPPLIDAALPVARVLPPAEGSGEHSG